MKVRVSVSGVVDIPSDDFKQIKKASPEGKVKMLLDYAEKYTVKLTKLNGKAARTKQLSTVKSETQES